MLHIFIMNPIRHTFTVQICLKNENNVSQFAERVQKSCLCNALSVKRMCLTVVKIDKTVFGNCQVKIQFKLLKLKLND